MEQYEIPPKLSYETIRTCLNNFKTKSIFIRPVGSTDEARKAKMTTIKEDLEDKTLDIKQTREGLSIYINNSNVFLFEQEGCNKRAWGRRWSLAYERDPDPVTGVIPALGMGINPDDTRLPPVNTSSLRCANKEYMFYLNFHGKIPLKFHSYIFPDEKVWKYWVVDLACIEDKPKDKPKKSKRKHL
jgi:hypothetical protein